MPIKSNELDIASINILLILQLNILEKKTKMSTNFNWLHSVSQISISMSIHTQFQFEYLIASVHLKVQTKSTQFRCNVWTKLDIVWWHGSRHSKSISFHYAVPKWIIISEPVAKLLIILIAKCTKPPSRVAKLMSVSIYFHMWFRQSIESS